MCWRGMCGRAPSRTRSERRPPEVSPPLTIAHGRRPPVRESPLSRPKFLAHRIHARPHAAPNFGHTENAGIATVLAIAAPKTIIATRCTQKRGERERSIRPRFRGSHGTGAVQPEGIRTDPRRQQLAAVGRVWLFAGLRAEVAMRWPGGVLWVTMWRTEGGSAVARAARTCLNGEHTDRLSQGRHGLR